MDKNNRYISDSSFFRFFVEMPDQDHFSHGRISLQFNTPVIHFGWPASLLMSMFPIREQRRYAIQEAIRGFTSMIDRELQRAAEALDEQDKEVKP